MKSVHLQATLNLQNIPFHENIIIQMDFTRKICSAISSIRKKNNINARQPLSKVIIFGKAPLGTEMLKIIEDESNCKSIKIIEDFSSISVQKTINLEAKTIAKRIGKDFQAVLKQAKAGNYTQDGESIIINGHKISKNEFEINLKLEGETENYTSIEGKFLIMLNLEITPELEMEGISRNFIRTVQNARKESNLELSNNINLTLHFTEDNLEKQGILTNITNIQNQTLATHFSISSEKQQVEFSQTTSFSIEKIS